MLISIPVFFQRSLDITLQRKQRRVILFLITATLCLAYGGTAILFGLLFLLQFGPGFLPWWFGCLVGGTVLCVMGTILLRSFLRRRGALEQTPVTPVSDPPAPLPAAPFNAEDYILLDLEQIATSNSEMQHASNKEGGAWAGAFKIYVVDPSPFLEIRSGPGLPPGGILSAPYEQLPYEQGWWPQHLQQFTLSEILIDDTDVEIYDWEEQKLILTEQATRRLREGPAYMDLGKIFVVRLGEERLYGGVLVSIFSPRAVRCPVISLGFPEGNRNVLLLFPSVPPGRGGGRALMKWINVEAMRSHFLALRKLGVKRDRSER